MFNKKENIDEIMLRTHNLGITMEKALDNYKRVLSFGDIHISPEIKNEMEESIETLITSYLQLINKIWARV